MLDRSLRNANIPKPQELFEKKVDNFDKGPWKPILTRKPHAKRPLEESVVPFTDEENKLQYAQSLPWFPCFGNVEQGATGQVTRMTKKERKFIRVQSWNRWLWSDLHSKRSMQTSNGKIRYRHPYELEIMDLKFPGHVYEQREPIKHLPISSTPATWVNTYEQVLEMLEELKGASEIAVDLEHHDWRTYRGLLSLMQISTREKDWLVDTLVPWRHKLEILNEVFADPKIIKVRA